MCVVCGDIQPLLGTGPAHKCFLSKHAMDCSPFICKHFGLSFDGTNIYSSILSSANIATPKRYKLYPTGGTVNKINFYLPARKWVLCNPIVSSDIHQLFFYDWDA